MNWFLKLIGRNFEITESKILKLLLNLLGKKNNFLIDGVLQRKLIQIMLTLSTFAY